MTGGWKVETMTNLEIGDVYRILIKEKLVKKDYIK